MNSIACFVMKTYFSYRRCPAVVLKMSTSRPLPRPLPSSSRSKFFLCVNCDTCSYVDICSCDLGVREALYCIFWICLSVRKVIILEKLLIKYKVFNIVKTDVLNRLSVFFFSSYLSSNVLMFPSGLAKWGSQTGLIW